MGLDLIYAIGTHHEGLKNSMFTRSIAIVGTSEIRILRREFAMETSQLLRTNFIVSEVRSRISSWIGLGLESILSK